jgi:hypothetical protein
VPINFHELIGDGGEDGARKKFEQLITQLAYARHRALGVLARPGDWGIDAFVGKFDGMVAVWQAKFFLQGIEDSQKAQIRESFAAAIAAAEREGYHLEAWTLAFPSTFGPDGWKWWEGWKGRQEKKHGLVIQPWTDTVLESMLLTPDAVNVARNFFPNSVPGGPTETVAEVLPLPDEHNYDRALFVRQLEAAEILENESAKQQFFNYEALARDVADKADPTEIKTLQALEAEVRAIWETRFNAANLDPSTGQDPQLHMGVMEAIRSHYASATATLPPMSTVHRWGTMHRVVENGDAGWVGHFRDIATAYRA